MVHQNHTFPLYHLKIPTSAATLRTPPTASPTMSVVSGLTAVVVEAAVVEATVVEAAVVEAAVVEAAVVEAAVVEATVVEATVVEAAVVEAAVVEAAVVEATEEDAVVSGINSVSLIYIEPKRYDPSTNKDIWSSLVHVLDECVTSKLPSS